MGEARDVAERFYKLFEAGDLDGTDELFADSCKTVTPMATLDKSEHKAFGQAFKNGLPDAHMEVVRAVESGNELFVAGRFKGTHKGDLVSPQGTVPASGNAIDVPFTDYWKVAGGKVVEHEALWDQMTMMGQMGALPA